MALAAGVVVAALHALVAQTATLVDLDAMEEEAANLNVLQLNGTEKVKSMDLWSNEMGRLSRGIMGAGMTVR